jgi:hypothetical protein
MLSSHYEIIIFVLLLVIVVLLFRRKNSRRADKNLYKKSKSPYILKNSIFTNNEQQLMETIKIIASKHRLNIVIKPFLIDFIDIKYDRGGKRVKFQNRIKTLHIDFLLCDFNYKPLLAIIADYSTNISSRNQNAFINNIFQSVNLEIAYVYLYYSESLEKQIMKKLNPLFDTDAPIGGEQKEM